MHRRLPAVCFAIWLVGALTSGSNGQTVQIRPAIADPDGTLITTIQHGEEFLFRLYVQDLRSSPEGVFSAYVDVTYDALLFDVIGEIISSPNYPYAVSGDSSTAGFIDELGATDGISPLGGDEFLLISVPMLANNVVGTGMFELGPADIVATHPVLVFGESSAVPPSQINFLATSLTVVPAPICPWPLLMASLMLGCRRGY